MTWILLAEDPSLLQVHAWCMAGMMVMMTGGERVEVMEKEVDSSYPSVPSPRDDDIPHTTSQSLTFSPPTEDWHCFTVSNLLLHLSDPCVSVCLIEG